MIIDLVRLRNKIDKCINVSEVYSFSSDELKNTDVTSLDDVKIEGTITLDALDELYLNLEVNGTMIIPCAITLKPVKYPFNIIIEGNLEEIGIEIDENDKKYKNTLDILPIIWENILMEIPMRVVSDDVHDVKTSGDGWRLITDDEDVKVNTELSKLKDLL